MYVVIVERNELYPVPSDLRVYGPYVQRLAAKDFAVSHLHETGEYCEVLEIQQPPVYGGGS